MTKFHFFILLASLLHFAIGSNLAASDVLQRSIKGYPKMEQALYDISKTKWSLPNMPDITEFDIILNINSIAQVKQNKSYTSETKHLKTLTGNVINRGPKEQKMYTAIYSESYQKSSSLTTTKSTESSNEFNTNNTLTAEVGAFIWKVKNELSLSYTRRWSESNSASKTETNTTTITVTAPSQEVVVDPTSKVNVTTQFFSFTITVQYLIDFRLDNLVSYYFEASDGNYAFFINLTRFENDINSIPFDNDDVKLVCSNSECFLKDVPVIVEETGYHIETKFGIQEPIEQSGPLLNTVAKSVQKLIFQGQQ